MSMGLDPLRDVRDVGIEQYRAGLGEYLGAVASDAWASNPAMAADRLYRTEVEDEQARRRGDQLLTSAEASERGREIGLRFDAPIAESSYAILADAKRGQIASESVFKRARLEQGYGTSDWLLAGGAEFLTMAADPLNIAASFVPVVGPARYAVMAERIGRFPAALVRGAAEGAAGQALLEPVIAADALQRGSEYTMLDTLVNLAFGSGLGTVLHGAAYGVGAGFRFMRDRYVVREETASPARPTEPAAGRSPPVVEKEAEPPPRQPVAEKMEALRPETRDTAMRTAVAQLVQDKPVDIEPILFADPQYAGVREAMAEVSRRLDTEELQRRSAASAAGALPSTEPPPDWQPTAEELQVAIRASRGWTPEKALARPQSLFDFVRTTGGLIAESAEGQELRASDLADLPGLLRTREVGRQADHMAQAAAEAGFRLGKETATGSGVDVDAFVKALIEDASGRRKHFPDDAHTTAWQAQQEYFAHFAQDLRDLGFDPKGMHPRRVAWMLAQDRNTARMLTLLRQVDQLGPDSSLELAARLDAERAAIEREILASEPGRLESDAGAADHREVPAATLAELERYYADLERAAGEDQAIGRPARPDVAGGRPPEAGEPAAPRPDRGDPAAENAGRRQEGEEGPGAADQRTANLAGFAEGQAQADLHADPAALAFRDERLAAEAREVKQLLDEDLAAYGKSLDEATRAMMAEVDDAFAADAKAIDTLAACQMGGR